MPSAIRRVVRAGRNFEWTWRYAFNLSPTLRYRFSRRELSVEARRVLSELNRNGVAVTSVEALLGPDSRYEELARTVEELECERADAYREARASAQGEGETGQKTFIYELLGRYPVFDPSSVYARFALQRPLLQIANAYFGMFTRLRYYNVWRTFAGRSEARESQLWHRDREDHFILKMFVYLSDVDEGCGPFTYAAGSHPKGTMRREPDFFLEENVRRSTDAQMTAAIPESHWVRCTGAWGTIVFADTRGYHKGGEARERERLMYTGMFTSQASESKEFLRREGQFPLPPDRELAFALSPPRPASVGRIFR
jgi:hypothetical protein